MPTTWTFFTSFISSVLCVPTMTKRSTAHGVVGRRPRLVQGISIRTTLGSCSNRLLAWGESAPAAVATSSRARRARLMGRSLRRESVDRGQAAPGGKRADLVGLLRRNCTRSASAVEFNAQPPIAARLFDAQALDLRPFVRSAREQASHDDVVAELDHGRPAHNHNHGANEKDRSADLQGP